MVTKTYLPSNICDSSDSSDSSDTSDSFFFIKPKFHQKTQTQIVMKLNKSNCDVTQKIKLWWNSKTQIVIKLKKKTQIVIKLKNLICDETQKL